MSCANDRETPVPAPRKSVGNSKDSTPKRKTKKEVEKFTIENFVNQVSQFVNIKNLLQEI